MRYSPLFFVVCGILQCNSVLQKICEWENPLLIQLCILYTGVGLYCILVCMCCILFTGVCCIQVYAAYWRMLYTGVHCILGYAVYWCMLYTGVCCTLVMFYQHQDCVETSRLAFSVFIFQFSKPVLKWKLHTCNVLPSLQGVLQPNPLHKHVLPIPNIIILWQ